MKRFKYIRNHLRSNTTKFPQELSELRDLYTSLDLIDLEYLNWKQKKEKDMIREEALRFAFSNKSVDSEKAKKFMEDRVCNPKPSTADIMVRIEKGLVPVPGFQFNGNDHLQAVAKRIIAQEPVIYEEE